MKLDTTDTDFRDLERAIEGRGAVVRVPKLALKHLLHDHILLLEKATGPIHRGGKGFDVVAGDDQESLRRR